MPNTVLAAFWDGFKSPWNGFRYMWQEPKLWRYGLMPLLLNLLVTGVLAIALVGAAVYCIVALHPSFADGWLWRAVEACVVVAILMAAFAMAAIAWLILQSIFCSHFYAKLAEQVELRLGMNRSDIQSVALSHEIVDALHDSGFLIVANLGMFLLNFLPGIGSVIGVTGSYYFTCMTLGQEYFEYPLSLRGKRRQEKLAFAHRHRPQTLGLGTGVAAVSFVPLLNAVLLTTAVTGAVLLHRNMTKCDGGRNS